MTSPNHGDSERELEPIAALGSDDDAPTADEGLTEPPADIDTVNANIAEYIQPAGPSNAPVRRGPTPELAERQARAAAARVEWATLSEEEKAARIEQGRAELRRRIDAGEIDVPERS